MGIYLINVELTESTDVFFFSSFGKKVKEVPLKKFLQYIEMHVVEMNYIKKYMVYPICVNTLIHHHI